MKIFEQIKIYLRAKNYKNKYDKGGIAYINSTIQNGNTVLDIGAHKAGYTYYFIKNVGKNGKVYAFEPQSILFNYIVKIKKLFKWNNLAIERIALSNTKSKVNLYIPINKTDKESSPGASILESNNNKKLNTTEIVNTDTLDSYCSANNIQPNFIKIDVEGNELNVFKGGRKTLEKFKPKILVEIEARHIGNDNVIKTINFLNELGYNGKFINGLELIPIADFQIELHQNRKNMKNYCNNFIFE